MADPNLARQLETAKDVTAELNNQARLMESQLRMAGNLNVIHEIRKKIEEKYLTTEQIVQSVQNSITNKLIKVEKIQNDINKRLLSGRSTSAQQLLINKRIGELLSDQNKLIEEQAKLNAKISQHRTAEILGLTKFKEKAEQLKADFGVGGWYLMGLMASVTIWKKIFTVFMAMDESAAKFRMSMGFTRDVSSAFEKNVKESAFRLAAVGVTAEKLYDSIKAIADTMGSAQYSTAGITEDMALLNSQLGISQGVSATFNKSMAMASQSTIQAQSHMALFAVELSKAGGTNLGEIMKDVSDASKSSYSYISRSPIALVRAAIEARRMGTSLDSIVKSSQSVLNFTDSINKEMEASVLLGRSINLQRMREYAFVKDAEGVNREILKIAKETNFERLDPFTAEAVASALGKQAGEVSAILQTDKQRMDLIRRAREDEKLAKQLKLYENIKEVNEDIVKKRAEDVRYQLMTQNNQSRIQSISLAWQGILQKVGEVYLPIIDTILGKVSGWLSKISFEGHEWLKWVLGVGSALVVVGTIITAVLTKMLIGQLIGKAVGNVANATLTGVSKGISSMADPKVFVGIAAIALLGFAIRPFVTSMKMLTGLDWNSLGVATAGLIIFTAAAFGLGALLTTGAGALLFGAGLLGIAGLGFSLQPLGKSAMMAGQGLQMLGVGFTAVVDGFDRLSKMSFVGVTLDIINMTAAMVDLAKALNQIPTMNLGKLENINLNMGTPAGGVAAAEFKTALIDTNAKLDILANKLDIISNKDTNLYMDGDKMNQVMDRSNRFSAGRGTNDTRKR